MPLRPPTRWLLFFFSLCLLDSCALFSDTAEDSDVTKVASEESSPEPKADQDPATSTVSLIRKRIVILPFNNTSPLGGEILAEHATHYVRDRASKIPELVITPETEVENWQALQGDKLSPEFRAAREQAQMQGISGVISGTIEQVLSDRKGEEVGLFRTHELITGATLRFEIYDLAQSRSLMNRLTASETHEQVTEFFLNRYEDGFDLPRAKIGVQIALDKVLSELGLYAKRIDWTGRIAKVDLDRFYINGGELTGISKGQLLKVFEEEQSISNPDDKSLIGFAPGRFKGFLRVIDLFGDDGAVAVVHSGGGFRERDRIRLVSQKQ